MTIGVVKSFDLRRGAGLITPEDGGPDVFVHESEVERAALPRLNVGDRVSFDLRTDRARDKSFATNLAIV